MSTKAGPAIREAGRGDAQQIAALLTQLGYPSTGDRSVSDSPIGCPPDELALGDVSPSSLELRLQQ